MKNQKNKNTGDVVNGVKIVNGPDETTVKGIVKATIEEEYNIPLKNERPIKENTNSVLTDCGQKKEALEITYDKLKSKIEEYQKECNLLEKELLETENKIKDLSDLFGELDAERCAMVFGIITIVVWQIVWIVLKNLGIIGDFLEIGEGFFSWIIYFLVLGMAVGCGAGMIVGGMIWGLLLLFLPKEISPSRAIKIKKAQQTKDQLEQDLKIFQAKLDSAKKELSKLVSALSKIKKIQ